MRAGRSVEVDPVDSVKITLDRVTGLELKAALRLFSWSDFPEFGRISDRLESWDSSETGSEFEWNAEENQLEKVQ